jgi:hypothetical protein
MNTHPYLRAYMAGIAAPSVALLIALTTFILTRLVFHVPIPIERVIIFPMAVIPTAFGIWNIVYVWSRPHRSWPIGFHGALLPFIIVALGSVYTIYGGFLTAGPRGVTWFQAISVPYSLLVLWFFGAMVFYYLVWKYVVGFLNQVLGIA